MSFGAIAFTGAVGRAPRRASARRVALRDRGSGRGSSCSAAALRGRAPAVARAVSPLVLVFLPWLPFPVPPAFLVWTGALRVARVDRGRVRRSSASAVRRLAFSRTRRTRWRSRGVLSFLRLLARRVPRLAVAPRRRRAALSRHHAEPALRRRPEDREQPQARRLSRLLRRRPPAARDPPPAATAQMYSVHAPGPAGADPAGVRDRRLPRRRRLPDPGALGCLRAGVVAGLADDRQPRRRLVRLGGGHAVGAVSARELHRFSRRLPARRSCSPASGRCCARNGKRTAPANDVVTSWRPWLWHGAALAVLPWLHTRFAVLAATLGGLILVRLARTRNPFTNATAFLAVPAAGAIAWLGFFLVVYGTLDPTAPYGGEVGSSFAFLPNGFGGLFFDQGFGLLATAPVLARRVRRFRARAPAGRRMAGRGAAIPARRRHLRDVVGGLERAGAVPRAAAAAARHSRGVRLGGHFVTRREGGDAVGAARQRLALGGDGRRRRRAARLSRAQRGGPDRGAVSRLGEPRRRSAVGVPGVRAAAGAAGSGRTGVAAARRAIGIRRHAALGDLSRPRRVSRHPDRPPRDDRPTSSCLPRR